MFGGNAVHQLPKKVCTAAPEAAGDLVSLCSQVKMDDPTVPFVCDRMKEAVSCKRLDASAYEGLGNIFKAADICRGIHAGVIGKKDHDIHFPRSKMVFFYSLLAEFSIGFMKILHASEIIITVLIHG